MKNVMSKQRHVEAKDVSPTRDISHMVQGDFSCLRSSK